VEQWKRNLLLLHFIGFLQYFNLYNPILNFRFSKRYFSQPQNRRSSNTKVVDGTIGGGDLVDGNSSQQQTAAIYDALLELKERQRETGERLDQLASGQQQALRLSNSKILCEFIVMYEM
jgi:hypothetical protein